MRGCELDSYGSGWGPMLGSYRHRNKIQIPFLAYCHLFSLNWYPMQCNLIPLTYYFWKFLCPVTAYWTLLCNDL